MSLFGSSIHFGSLKIASYNQSSPQWIDARKESSDNLEINSNDYLEFFELFFDFEQSFASVTHSIPFARNGM